MKEKLINKQDKDNDALIQGKAEIKRLFLRKRNRLEEEIKKKCDAEKKMYEEAMKKCEEVKEEKLQAIHIQIEEEENKAISELEELIEMDLIIKRAREKNAKNQ